MFDVMRLRCAEKRVCAAVLGLFLITGAAPAWACTIAVAAGKATKSGSPLIWKNLDTTDTWHTQLKYFPARSSRAGGYLLACRNNATIALLTGSPITSSAGANESGFALVMSAVAEAYNVAHSITELSTELLETAVKTCATLSDFEKLLKIWPLTHYGTAISSNFAAVDAQGGAAMYELFTGYASAGYMPIRYRKYDANTGTVVDQSGKVLAQAGGSNFRGYFVRSNYNDYVPWDGGQERRARAEELLGNLTGPIDCRAFMVISRDMDDINADNNTTYCISRSSTRFGMVFEGVPAGGDKRLAVMWLNQGEPTVGCYIPFFPAAEAVSPLAYQDTTIGGIGYDLNDSCFINQAYSTAETRYGLYSTNLGDLVSGMYDMSIDPTALAAVQAWSLPIEAAVLENTEIFMGLLGADSGRITAANMKAFSDYCAVYTYWNYLKASPAAVPWNCPIPE